MHYIGAADGWFHFRGESHALRPAVYLWLVQQFGQPGPRFAYYWDSENAVSVTIRDPDDAMIFRLRWA